MKKYLILIIVAFSATIANAGDGGLFSYDREQVDAQMSELTALEGYLISNQDLTMQDLVDIRNPMLGSMSAAPADAVMVAEGPLGIPSFLWGFCFNIPGMVVVYLVTDDREETKKALIGCVVSAVLFGGGYWGWNW